MCADRDNPRAIFLSSDGEWLPDNVVCSGLKFPELRGRACIHSDAGRFPLPQRLGESDSTISPEKNSNNGLTPPCAIMQLGRLEDWRNVVGEYPRDMHGLLVFKCKQMFLFVIPGLREDSKMIDTGESAGND